MKKILGWHYTLDFQVKVGSEYLSSAEKLREILLNIAKAGNVKIIGDFFHPFPEGGGVSGVILIEESHIAVHTWPEYNFVSLDIYYCDPDVNIEKILEQINEIFKPQNLRFDFKERGF